MTKLITFVVLLFTALVCFESRASAQTTEFTYQGNLKDSGAPANANYDFEFALFDALSGGIQIGATIPKNGVAVANGVFAVKLDFGPVFPGANRYLEIRVRLSGQPGITPLVPRQLVNSAPYSVKSLNADSAAIATNAVQLGGVAANQYVLTGDARLSDARDPLPGSANYIQNTANQQAGSNFNISGNGVIGGTLKATGTVESTSGGFKFPDGTTQVSAAAVLAGGVYPASAYANLGAAITAIGSTVATLQISTPNYPSGGTVMVPSSLTLEFVGNGSINIASGQTVTIQSDGSRWPLRQIFINALAGQGTASFVGNNVQKDFWVTWWGAKGDGVTDNTAAINAAQAAIPDGRTLHFSFGTYKHTGITFDHHAHITIMGSDSENGYSDRSWSPELVYTGPAGGTAITFFNMFSSTLRGINSDPGQADIHLFMTMIAGGSPGFSSQNVIEHNTFLGNTRVGYICIKIDNTSGENNEQHTIYKNLITGGNQTVPNATGVGVYLGHTNVKEVKVTGNAFSALDRGIEGHAGSVYSIENHFDRVNYHHYGYFSDVTEINDNHAEVGLSALFVPAGFDFKGSIRHYRFDGIDVDSGASVTIPVIHAQGYFSVEDSNFNTLNSNFGNKLIYNPSPGTSQLFWLRNRVNSITEANFRAGIETYVTSLDDGAQPSLHFFNFRSSNYYPGDLAILSLASNSTSNTDLNGEVTIGSGGSATYNFARPLYTLKPVCTLSQQSAPTIIPWYTATTATLTIHADVGAVVSYHCIGRK